MMSETPAGREGPEQRDTVRYHVVVRGQIDSSLVGPLEGMVMERGGPDAIIVMARVASAKLITISPTMSPCWVSMSGPGAIP